MKRAQKIVVAGAGIGGLTVALALLQRGFAVQVLEKSPVLGEVGAGVQIGPNGTRVLHALGLEEQVRAASFDPQAREMRIWNTGIGSRTPFRSSDIVARFGFPHVTMHRADLHAILVEAINRLDAGAIRLQAPCAGFRDAGGEVQVRLDDGEVVSGAALVGADGIHSRVRAQLFGESKARFTGGLAWRGLIPIERLPPHLRERTAQVWVGPKGHFIVYPIRRGELINVVGHTERDDWRVESWIERGSTDEFAADFAGWHEEIATLIRHVEQPYKWALYLHDPLPRWSVGRVTLLGDACHATLPYLAQGANMAIEDGLVLARMLEEHAGNVAQAFRAYEALRIPRTTKIVNASAQNVRRFHHPDLADPAVAMAYLDKSWAELTEIRAEIYAYDATAEAAVN